VGMPAHASAVGAQKSKTAVIDLMSAPASSLLQLEQPLEH
jgi:hypothetical protein